MAETGLLLLLVCGVVQHIPTNPLPFPLPLPLFSLSAKDDDSKGDGNVSKELFTEGQKSPINSFLKKIHLDKSVFHFHDMTTKHKNIFYSRLGDVMIAFLLFGALTFMLGFDFMLYGGAGWSVFLLWFCSLTAGTALKKVKVPPLLGNLIVGTYIYIMCLAMRCLNKLNATTRQLQ